MRASNLARTAMFLLMAACSTSEQPLIGYAYAIGNDVLSVADIVKELSDSGLTPAPIALKRWEVWDVNLPNRDGQQAARFAETAGLIGVVGHAGSRDALLAAEVYNRAGLPQLVTTATTRRLGERGPWTFRLGPDDATEGQFIADYALDSLRAKRVALLYVTDEYGVGIRDGVSSRLTVRGTPAVDQAALTIARCTSEVTKSMVELTVRAAMRRANPDVVVLATGSSNGLCVVSAVLKAVPNVRIICGDGIGLVPADLDSLAPAERASVRLVSFWTPGTDSATTAFLDRARRVLKREPTAADALAYDGIMLLSTAVREVGPNRTAIREWLSSLGTTRPGWTGVTGAVSFSSTRGELLRMMGAAR